TATRNTRVGSGASPTAPMDSQPSMSSRCALPPPSSAATSRPSGTVTSKRVALPDPSSNCTAAGAAHAEPVTPSTRPSASHGWRRALIWKALELLGLVHQHHRNVLFDPEPESIGVAGEGLGGGIVDQVALAERADEDREQIGTDRHEWLPGGLEGGSERASL